MALFTTATLAAIGTAVGMTATAAAAVAPWAALAINVSMYVGFTGLALKVVGAATGNKTLSKIGTYMGYAGLIGGIVSAGVDSIAHAAILEPFMQETMSQMAADQAADLAATGTIPVGTDATTTLSTDALNSAKPNIIDSSVGTTVDEFGRPSGWGHTKELQRATEGFGERVNASVSDEIGMSGQGSMVEDYPEPGSSGDTLAASPAKSSPASTEAQAATVTGRIDSATTTNSYGVKPLDETLDVRAGAHYRGGPPPQSSLLSGHEAKTPGEEQSWKEWWKSVDPSVKAMSGLALGQGLTGAAQGWFAGQSAEEKLKLETLMNEQRQTELQRRIFNASYAPKVFKGSTGLLQQGGA